MLRRIRCRRRRTTPTTPTSSPRRRVSLVLVREMKRGWLVVALSVAQRHFGHLLTVSCILFLSCVVCCVLCAVLCCVCSA